MTSTFQWNGLAIAAAACLTACSGGDDSSVADNTVAPLTVPKVTACQSGDKPEQGLQGQVPAAERAAGFKGYNCNLTLVGQSQNEGGNWSVATVTDAAGRTCAYYSTATATASRVNPGVPVIDMTDRSHPVRVASLTTKSMMNPWESLRVNQQRKLLIGDNAATGGPEVDIYDLSGDCRSPQLMSSQAVGTGLDGGVIASKAPSGHEGTLSPDGKTYWIGSPGTNTYYAVDVVNTRHPQMIASFDVSSLGLPPDPGGRVPTAHGLSVSEDGNRVYAVIDGGLGTAISGTPGIAPADKLVNGFVILDTSEVQQRLPNAKVKVVSKALFQDGSVAQHTIPITVAGKPYVIMVDEGGSAGLVAQKSAAMACAAGMPPYPMARVFDISDEANPKQVSRLMLETHDPKNCDQLLPDIAGLGFFTYGSHYCSVDNRQNATALACGYFNSGVRVFDIRDIGRPKEIAYYNPPGVTVAPAGSSHGLYGWKSGGPDFCAAQFSFDFAKKQLTTICHDNGLLIMQFAPNTWPFAQSTLATSS